MGGHKLLAIEAGDVLSSARLGFKWLIVMHLQKDLLTGTCQCISLMRLGGVYTLE